MNVVYLGSGQFGIDSLDALVGSGHSLAHIITQPAHQAGRGRKPRPTPVTCWAEDHGLSFTETDDVNTPEMVGKVAELEPDLILVIAFGQKIGNELINLPPKGAVNVHASLLPKYRGAAPINWAIINGETETGISIITLAEKMDAGLILGQAKTDIGPDETAGQLHDRLAKMAAPLLIETLDKIAEGTAAYTAQDDSAATRAPKLKKADGFLDFAESAEILHRKIRGLTPWPGASATCISQKTARTERVTLTQSQPVKIPDPTNLAPGTFDENLNLICGQDALKVIKIKPAGSRELDFKDFVNGRATAPGDRFVKIEK